MKKKKQTPEEEHRTRIARLRELMAKESLDALLIADLADIRYFCGFTGSNGLLAVQRRKADFLTDSRYTIQAGMEVAGAKVSTVRDVDGALGKLFSGKGPSKVGLGAESVSHARWARLEKTLPGAELTDLEREIKALRIVKSGAEISKMAEAAKLSEEAFRRVASLVRPGTTERELSRALLLEVLKLGGEGMSFPPIVAAGERGALPHAVPGDRLFARGDLVVVDFGVLLDGYCSDQTVTLPVGKVSPKARKVYDTVLRAHDAAIKAVKPGVELSVIDKAARDIITDAGYGPNFGHGTGHGIGLEVHETPALGPKSLGVAQEGMVFTIEPGIYLTGEFGVRLEDTVVVEREGAGFVTGLSKEFGAYSP